MTRVPTAAAVALSLIAISVVVGFLSWVPLAVAQTYGDVPNTHWAYSYIASVTDRSVKGHRLLDDYGTAFKPERAITRELLARSLVLASGHYGEQFTPKVIGDVPPDHRYYSVIQMAVKRGYLMVDKEGNFDPASTVTSAQAEVAVVRWLKDKYSSADWTLLASLRPSRWEPNPGWKTGAPSYLPFVVASRQLQLRYNHTLDADDHETVPNEPIDRAEIAYMLYRGFQLGGEWTLYGLGDYRAIAFPPLSERQKEIASFALRYAGYPYVWAGEYPTKDSPYGRQLSGGFDCSGFVFYVMMMHFEYPITVNERGAHDMAERAKPRITRKNLTCGDLIFFGPAGPKSSVNSIYHAGLYLGNGWFIHSTGSSDGVTLCSLDASNYWKSAFAWGRRVLKPSELAVDSSSQAVAGSASVPPGE